MRYYSRTNDEDDNEDDYYGEKGEIGEPYETSNVTSERKLHY